MATVRKNITLEESEYEEIKRFARKVGMSFSEFIRKSSLNEIRRAENMDLAQFLRENCDYVSDEEQRELDMILQGVDLDSEDGMELTVNDIL